MWPCAVQVGEMGSRESNAYRLLYAHFNPSLRNQ